jgi:hypothetical protein
MTPTLSGFPPPEGLLINQIFGRESPRVLALIIRIADLSPAEVDQVTNAWKQVSVLDRARAWAQLTRATTDQERHRILAAACLARREALAVARRLRRMDWAFWAAASDAAAAVTAGTRIGLPYETLTAPLTAVMPALATCPGRADGRTARFGEDEPPAPPALRQGA